VSSAEPLFPTATAPASSAVPHHVVLSARVTAELRQRVHESGTRAGDADQSHTVRRLLAAALELEANGGRPDAPAPGQSRRNDPATAKRAAAAPRAGTQRAKVLEALLDADASPWELVDRTGIPYGSITPRIGELERGGWVEPAIFVGTSSPVTRTTPYGAEARVLTPTAKARAWAARP
jgi:hypothetical protein